MPLARAGWERRRRLGPEGEPDHSWPPTGVPRNQRRRQPARPAVRLDGRARLPNRFPESHPRWAQPARYRELATPVAKAARAVLELSICQSVSLLKLNHTKALITGVAAIREKNWRTHCALLPPCSVEAV